MTSVEQLPAFHLSYGGNFSSSFSSERDNQYTCPVFEKDELFETNWNSRNDSRSSQESFDSGYQSSSSSSVVSLQRQEYGRDVTSETHDLSFEKQEALTIHFQEMNDQETEDIEGASVLEACNDLLKFSQPGTSSTSHDWQEETEHHNTEGVEVLCRPIVPQYIVVKRPVGHLQVTVHQHHPCKALQCGPVLRGQSKSEVFSKCMEEVVPPRKAEVLVQGNAAVSECKYKVVSQSENETNSHGKGKVVLHSENRLEPHNKSQVRQCKPVVVSPSKADTDPRSKDKLASPHPHKKHVHRIKERGVLKSINKVQLHSKEQHVAQTKEKVVLRSMNNVEHHSKNAAEPRHREAEKPVESLSKGDEAAPCRCDVDSHLCEHLRESVLRLRKKKDPLFSKKRLRRLFRGQLRKLYVPEDLEEPPFQYVPEVLPTSATIKGVVPPLQESLMLLGEGLEAGSLVAQFEQLYRRKPGLTVTEARRQENEKKNRYRDISPYDSTRVILTTSPSGDYINASYVNMEVQASGIVNRYIASQGPLAGTCTDFWHMVWEQQSTLIVMLTTVVEQGRVKCHRYWPRLYETVEFGILQVTCNKEEETPGFAFREFTLISTETQEERHITHMQYLAWPDHGVPDDSTEFLNFVTQVRKARVGMVEPTIVHCSAGIGRTGVLILMETAQCLIEANEPIYPLDIVKAMRDQRAMMIQTASQFRFVCEAIHRVYTEELIKPLAEYEQR